MKRIFVGFLAIIFIVFLQLPMTAAQQKSFDSVITGKGDPKVDVVCIQEAVDKGGSVLLKGTFDFGQKGRVNIKNDIEIMGETDSKGWPLTKIKGGFWSFYSPLPSTELPLPGPGPKIKIKNIHFDGAAWTPMHFPYTSGAEIYGNKITNVQPIPVPRKWKGGDKLLVNAGALFGTFLSTRKKSFREL